MEKYVFDADEFKDGFKDFVKLRENCNDGYTPTTELEQGKEK